MSSGPRTSDLGRCSSWRIISTPPLSGNENMRYDAELLREVEEDRIPPTLRFFRFCEPTVSYGRLQKVENIRPLVPTRWSYVQRPTGGGVVFHQDDLSFSLSWKAGTPPLPRRPQEQYQWIHSVVLEALRDNENLRMAACCDVTAPIDPFAVRQCFARPVGFDLLQNDQKVLGGALQCTRRGMLYQGSLQGIPTQQLEVLLSDAFRLKLTSN